MAQPEYFARGAIAAAQVVAGLDADAIAARLEDRPLAIALGVECSEGEGHALADLTVRLCARLYPRLAIVAPSVVAGEFRALARTINPRVDFVDEAALAISIGSADLEADTIVYAGSNGWDALISTSGPQPLGKSGNPFGPGAAACLAAANAFRVAFFDQPLLDDELVFSTLELAAHASRHQPAVDIELGDDNTLVGVGAIGNGVVWALGRCGARGSLTLVDPEPVELSNLQRYVLAVPEDVDRGKVEVAKRVVSGLVVSARSSAWDEYALARGHRMERVLVALDSAYDRVAVQATLPHWLANAWTQPGDLGVSTHPSFVDGACLACLYLPAGPQKNEDKLIAEALGLPPEREVQIRQLLYTNEAPPGEFLGAVADALELSSDDLTSFRDRPLRDLYVEGICGGAVLPLDRVGMPRQEVHVPLAHQSALAGVLLAGRLVAAAIGDGPAKTEVTRLNILRPIADFLTQPAAKDPRGICICQDPIYVDAWRLKYERGSE